MIIVPVFVLFLLVVFVFPRGEKTFASSSVYLRRYLLRQYISIALAILKASLPLLLAI